MKKQIFILSLAILLITSVMAIGITFPDGDGGSWCGDEICDNYEEYNESNSLTIYYCPYDCGVLTSSAWCESTYNLIFERDCSDTDCPVCGGSSCDITRISDSSLNSWCTSNGYSKSGCSIDCPFPSAEKFAFFSITGNKCKDGLIIIGLILLIGGIIGGYYYKKNKR
jgi:hypothetical protein